MFYCHGEAILVHVHVFLYTSHRLSDQLLKSVRRSPVLQKYLSRHRLRWSLTGFSCIRFNRSTRFKYVVVRITYSAISNTPDQYVSPNGVNGGIVSPSSTSFLARVSMCNTLSCPISSLQVVSSKDFGVIVCTQ